MDESGKSYVGGWYKMNKRTETLLNLKKSIEANGIQEHYYCLNGCFCTIGHILNNEGFNLDAISGKLNGAEIHRLADYFVGKQMLSVLEGTGLTDYELRTLQKYNDRTYDDITSHSITDRKGRVLKYIDELLEETDEK
jgi:hypothetical protein